ncbi:hypothetical protein CYMTET_6741, partial [Cymbomonas tetramitiformis]
VGNVFEECKCKAVPKPFFTETSILVLGIGFTAVGIGAIVGMMCFYYRAASQPVGLGHVMAGNSGWEQRMSSSHRQTYMPMSTRPGDAMPSATQRGYSMQRPAPSPMPPSDAAPANMAYGDSFSYRRPAPGGAQQANMDSQRRTLYETRQMVARMRSAV